mmetsp:Transcript_114015/g.286502  ORF Transcript_114015/g.286502 Transcript_114015/m.286502 type:complete len:187 (-) Transcript_114015:137-697(-)
MGPCGGPRPRMQPGPQLLTAVGALPFGPYPTTVQGQHMANLMARLARERGQMAQEKFIAQRERQSMAERGGKQHPARAVNGGYSQRLPGGTNGRAANRGSVEGPSADQANGALDREAHVSHKVPKLKGRPSRKELAKFIMVDWSSLEFTLGVEDLQEDLPRNGHPSGEFLCLEDQEEFERLLAVIQ